MCGRLELGAGLWAGLWGALLGAHRVARGSLLHWLCLRPGPQSPHPSGELPALQPLRVPAAIGCRCGLRRRPRPGASSSCRSRRSGRRRSCEPTTPARRRRARRGRQQRRELERRQRQHAARRVVVQHARLALMPPRRWSLQGSPGGHQQMAVLHLQRRLAGPW